MHPAVRKLTGIVGDRGDAYPRALDDARDCSAKAGFRSPAPYEALVLAFGFGYWQGFWFLLDPRRDHLWDSEESDLSGRNPLSAERVTRAASPKTYPHMIFPEPGGILPWAGTDNGGRFFWLTDGTPDTWKTVYYPSRDPDFQAIESDCAEIAYALVSGELRLFEEEFGPHFTYSRSDAYRWPEHEA